MRVLLVEDNEVNMKLLVAYMRKLKLNHSTAINGLEALNTYKEAKGDFDAVFMGSSSQFVLFHFSHLLSAGLNCLQTYLCQ
jgi:CheY-like chemotaxis protein